MCSFHDTLYLQKPRPPTIGIHHDFNCYINERETPKTCLTNHKGSISHYIAPLVINSLGDGHTHKYTGIVAKSYFKEPVAHWPLAGA